MVWFGFYRKLFALSEIEYIFHLQLWPVLYDDKELLQSDFHFVHLHEGGSHTNNKPISQWEKPLVSPFLYNRFHIWEWWRREYASSFSSSVGYLFKLNRNRSTTVYSRTHEIAYFDYDVYRPICIIYEIYVKYFDKTITVSCLKVERQNSFCQKVIHETNPGNVWRFSSKNHSHEYAYKYEHFNLHRKGKNSLILFFSFENIPNKRFYL